MLAQFSQYKIIRQIVDGRITKFITIKRKIGHPYFRQLHISITWFIT
jgi:hypothetical protein